MDEQGWLACADPRPMLQFLRGKASDRKLRLFACASCRAIRDSQHLLGPSTLTVAERYADGLASDQDLATERRRNACFPEERWPLAPFPYEGAREAVDWLTHARDTVKIDPDASRHFPFDLDKVLQRSVLFLREIFGNPFGPVSLDPALRTPVVLALATAAYDNRIMPARVLEPDRLAVLADALEESGCAGADLLHHLRGPGPHVRGCWPLDLLLARG
jgi:hypothetical protein